MHGNNPLVLSKNSRIFPTHVTKSFLINLSLFKNNGAKT